jgi:hypothetical protein
MSARRNTLLAVLLVLGFVAWVIWSSVGAQAVECRVCLQFNGQENCAVASAANEEAAARTAQNTACGPLARGMNDAIACDNTPPAVRTCRPR